MKNSTLRDAFWDRVYEIARKDRDVLIISEDMGAPSLDKFRTDLASQFINVGIAEQQGLLLASGLALEGKHPLVYAIAPFVTLRCLEQIRVANSIMNIPVVLVGVGASFGYDDSGPTHHLIEDLAVMRAFPHITIHVPSDAVAADAVAALSCYAKNTSYVRLDRQPTPDIYAPGTDFSRGFSVLREGRDGLIVATGMMTHTALKVADRLAHRKKKVGVLDLYRIPPDEDLLAKAIRGQKVVLTIEEHFLTGGLGTYILELVNNLGLRLRVKRYGIQSHQGYCYVYGGRELIQKHYGLDVETIERRIAKEL